MSERLPPMLATRGEPFDSSEHLFEVKWNGVRALAVNHGKEHQVWGRDLADYSGRYPELEVLGRLPPGTVVDGELVLFRKGLSDFEAILARHQLTNLWKIRYAFQQGPVTFVLFDLLHLQGRCLLSEPFQARRALLGELLGRLREPRLLLSEGVVGAGRAFFEQVMQQGQEGMMAKHLASRYVPGRRSPAWRKIKPAHCLVAAIVGFTPGRYGLRSLLVAAPREGQLRYVAKVRSGFNDSTRARLRALLAERVRAQPVVPCPGRAIWVQPDLYCQVQYQEWTPRGHLRFARFRRLLP
jgi:bifunctional non-homologous end joining protein LigD